jgi:hypothetical protein
MDMNSVADLLVNAITEIKSVEGELECTFDINGSVVELVCTAETGHSFVAFFELATKGLLTMAGFAI